MKKGILGKRKKYMIKQEIIFKKLKYKAVFSTEIFGFSSCIDGFYNSSILGNVNSLLCR